MSRGEVEAGSVVGGRFVVCRALGKGGMGAVVLAEDRETGALVALKLLHELLARESVHLARFRREAKVIGMLDHPHGTARQKEPEGRNPLAIAHLRRTRKASR
jgi:serine/threonine-protein kinase